MKKIVIISTLMIVMAGCANEEQPGPEFFLGKEWKLTEVYVNGELNSDLDKDQYRLILREDFSMTRINFDGSSQDGEWAIENGFNQLVFFTNSTFPERYLILSLQVRKLELHIIQSDNKVGSTEFRYILKPVRP